MKITLLNTDAGRGGAARAALRLHRALRAVNPDTTMLVRREPGTEPGVLECGGQAPRLDGACSLVQDCFIDAHRTALTNSIFSFGLPGVECAAHPAVSQADVLNLHWVTRFLAPSQIAGFLALGKPVVWTLHDQWPMTGGCHYPAGCRQFTSQCGDCPQLDEDPFKIVEMIFRDKMDAYADRVAVVTPSQWMANEARASRVFRNSRIEVIPNGLDLRAFSPRPKSQARAALGMPADAFVVLFACSSALESRKGADLLNEIAVSLGRMREFDPIRKSGRLRLLLFGWSTDGVTSRILREKHLGFLNDDDGLAAAYSAADVLLHLASEDNLPNTVAEAMACGTPVIAFDAGGARELVADGETGRLIPAKDVDACVNALCDLIRNRESCATMGNRSRKRMEESFGDDLQARRYLRLFEELIRNPAEKAADADGAKGRAAGRLLELLPDLASRYVSPEFASLREQVRSLKGQLARTRRNIGYRFAHGVTNALKAGEKIFRRPPKDG